MEDLQFLKKIKKKHQTQNIRQHLKDCDKK